MASRKKPDAELRTVDMFTGKTRLEEAADQQAEEEERFQASSTPRRPLSYDDALQRGHALLPHAGHSGEDVRLIEHPNGGVLLVATRGRRGVLSHYVSVFLTRGQVMKLKQLLGGGEP